MIQRALLIETCNLVYIKADRIVNLPDTRECVDTACCMLRTMPLSLRASLLTSAMLTSAPHTFRCSSVSMLSSRCSPYRTCRVTMPHLHYEPVCVEDSSL